MNKVKYVAGILVIILIIHISSFLMRNTGQWDEINAPQRDNCRQITISPGTEDVTIDTSTNIVFISADDRRKDALDPSGKNGIYAFDLADPSSIRLVSPNGFADFHPHGMSLWSGDRTKRLFVINHREDGENTVDVLTVGKNGALKLIKVISFDDMHSPNDIVAVGPDSFYITNDHGFRRGVMNKVESYLNLPLASVAYFSGQEGRKVIRGLTYANGINQSLDGSTIYVSETTPRTVTAYKRDIATGDLEEIQTFDVNLSPDNIDVDSDGNLWVAGHPNLLDFLAHAADASVDAPSHALRLNPQTAEMEDVYYNTGDEISASSVAAYHQGMLIIGAVFDNHVVLCPVEK